MTQPEFTVCVLLYGDHPDLAERCLGSLWPLQRSGLIDLRVGLNECSDRTTEYVDAERVDSQIALEIDNIHKYPMMRRLQLLKPLKKFFMWFDDDSYVAHPDPTAWLAKLRLIMNTYDVIGQTWHMPLAGNQHQWIKSKTWYTGKPVGPRHSVAFPQGGWWVTSKEVIEKYNWPDLELVRKGGDVMFGELCRQQGLKVANVGTGYKDVRINADKDGRHSEAKTRGPKVEHMRPVGFDYATKK